MTTILKTEHITITEGIPSIGDPFYILWIYENDMLYGFDRVSDLPEALRRAIKYLEVQHGAT